MCSQSAYTWRSFDGPLPGESSWSILHKFCYRNAISINQLISHIRDSSNTPKESFVLKCDLRFNKGNPTRAIMKLADINPHNACDLITLDCFTNLKDMAHMREISAPYLRYCPICILEGFHATRMQLLLWNECPIHKTISLIDRCTMCGERIPYIPPKSHLSAYSCLKCKTKLWRNREGWGGECHPCDLVTEQHHRLRPSIPISLTTFGLVKKGFISPSDMRDYLKMSQYFLSYIEGEPSGVELSDYNISNITISSSSSRTIFSLASTYKCISRRIRRQVIKVNSTLLSTICCTSVGIDKDYKLHDSSMIHLAYAQWRSHWEATSVLHKLNGPTIQSGRELNFTLKNIQSEKYTQIKLSSKSHSQESNAMLHVFALSCIISFRQILIECLKFTHLDWISELKLPHLSSSSNKSPFFAIKETDGGGTEIFCFSSKELENADFIAKKHRKRTK